MSTLYIIGGLTTIGYLLSKIISNNNNVTSLQLDNQKIENTANYIKQNNILNQPYIQEEIQSTSDNSADINSKANDEQSNINKTRSRYTDKFSETVEDELKTSKDVIISPLTGIEIPSSQWSPDAKPFYKGRVSQNVDLDNSNINLGWMTGTDKDLMKKKEIAKPMFAPTKNLSNVNGAGIYASDIKHRYNTSKYIRGERPFEQVQVGPGLNKGYTSKGSGGFQQTDTRDYILPKNVDQLRTLNNPKLIYKGRVSAPKKSIDSRGKMGLMFKNKVETSFNQSHEDLLVTTGAVIKAAGRSTIIIKNTNRKISHNVMGNPKYTIDGTTIPGNYKISNKLTYCNDQARNVDGEHIGQSEADDFGKKSFFLDINKRNVTELRTHTTNVMKAVKAIVMPITDLFKPTIKETTEVNVNSGNMGQQVSRITMKDKDNQQLNKTLRETLDPEDTTRNVSTNTKQLYLHDPNDILKRTIKETTSNNDHSGHVQNIESGSGYLTNVHEALPTGKECTHIEYMGTGNSSNPQATSYENIIHNKTSGSREETLEGRSPTTSNVSKQYGADSINMSSGKNECGQKNDRGLIKTTMNYIGTNINQFKNSQTTLRDTPNSARDDLDVLSQLKNNPYVIKNLF